MGAYIVLYYLLAVLLGALWRLTPFEIVVPDVALVFAFYLGVTGRSELWQATAGVLAIGYLADVLSGAPRGVSSLVLGVLCILCRMASSRLLLRGRLFVGIFAFAGSLVAALMVLFVRASLNARVGPLGRELLVALGSAFLTALSAPPLFRLCRRLDARFARTEREREAIREGYLG